MHSVRAFRTSLSVLGGLTLINVRRASSAWDRTDEHHPPLVVLLPSLAGGGAERVAATLLPRLAARFSTTLVLLQDERAYPVPPGVPVRVLCGCTRKPAGHVLRAPLQLWRLVCLVRELGCPPVLSFMEQANLLNLVAARVTGHRAVVSQRTDPVNQYQGRGLMGRAIVTAAKVLYPKAVRVLAVSPGVGQSVQRLYGVAEDRVCVVPNPVDIERLRAESTLLPKHSIRQPFLLHIGRLQLKSKAQDVLLDAFRRLREEFPELSLALLGEGPDRKAIEALVRRYDLVGSVHLLGWQQNVAAYMARAKALILCSQYEGWPNVLVEAMACGCPVVSTDCPHGPREILKDGEFGLLASVGDPRALADAIRRVLTDPATETRLRDQGPSRADDFSVNTIAALYQAVVTPSDVDPGRSATSSPSLGQPKSVGPGYTNTGSVS